MIGRRRCAGGSAYLPGVARPVFRWRRSEAMSHERSDLADEFPHAEATIAKLKTTNAHFAKVVESYQAVNKEIDRIESELEPTSDETLEDFKKQRLAFLDEISAMIAKDVD
jgi:uncharacterized protein